jgi:hypothetical protein
LDEATNGYKPIDERRQKMRDEEKVVPNEDDVDREGRRKSRRMGSNLPPAEQPEDPTGDQTEEDESSSTPSTSSHVDQAPERPTETQTEPWPRPR